jgi:hypothetical protein
LPILKVLEPEAVPNFGVKRQKLLVCDPQLNGKVPETKFLNQKLYDLEGHDHKHLSTKVPYATLSRKAEAVLLNRQVAGPNVLEPEAV